MLSCVLCIIVIAILLCALGLKIYLRVTLGICKSKNKLKGKVAIVTGASAGIGKETALDLASREAKVILACRDLRKAEKVKDEIILTTGNKNVILKHLDLASLKSVRNFAADILKTEKKLDILINNAGVAGLEKKLTEDGYEYTFQANYLGHFLLINLLLGLMKSSAPSRIINVSSMAHTFTKELNLNNLNSEIEHDAGDAYYKSKLSQVLMTSYLAPLISQYDITINSLHPGAVKTEIFRNGPKWMSFLLIFILPFFKTSKEGAQTTIHLAVADEVAGITGKYFSDCKVAETSKLAKDQALAKDLWVLSERLVKLKPSERHF